MLSKQDASGYDLKKKLEKERYHFWNESYGQIYPMLKKLVANNLSTLEVIERDEQPDMKVYTITDDGREELERWLRQPAEPHPIRNEMLLKLFFGASTSIDMNIAHVERLKDRLQRQQENLDQEREELIDEFGEDDQMVFFGLLTSGYGQVVNEALQKWCDETLEKLRDMRN